MHTIRLTPLEEDTGTRLDSFLSRRVEGLTRSAAARLLAEGCVTCDGAVPGKSYRIAGGEELCVTLPEAEEPEAVPQDIPLDVVYEDEDVIVVNKPVGMVVHPAAGPPGRHAGQRPAAPLRGLPLRHRRREAPRHRSPHRPGHQRPDHRCQKRCRPSGTGGSAGGSYAGPHL